MFILFYNSLARAVFYADKGKSGQWLDPIPYLKSTGHVAHLDHE